MSCNEILKNLGIEERYYLGAHARKSKINSCENREMLVEIRNYIGYNNYRYKFIF